MTASDEGAAERRLAALERYGVLRGETPPALSALVELASRLAGAQKATVNLHTDVEQVQVATVGFEGERTLREASMCALVVDEERPVLLPDASADDRYADNPFVTGETANVRFYAAHPLRTPDDVVIGTLCVYDEEVRPVDPQMESELRMLAERIVDVLELDLTSRRLSEANEQLLWSNEALGAFAGQVSHDLKNPLAAVIMSLGLAAEELGDHPAADLVERAGRSAERMSVMISDLLAFAGGRVSDHREEVDLAALVAVVVEDLGEALADVEVAVVGELGLVPADPAPLRMVVQNLLANAAKFTRPGVPARVEVRACRFERYWRLEVADNGRGVPEADRTRVLEPLVRLDRRVPGTGIGLATVSRVVAGHGGTVGLADGLDAGDGERGLQVWLEIPVD